MAAVREAGRKQLIIAGAVADASGTFDRGVGEPHRDRRNDIEDPGALLANHIASYRNLMASHFARKQGGAGELHPSDAPGRHGPPPGSGPRVSRPDGR